MKYEPMGVLKKEYVRVEPAEVVPEGSMLELLTDKPELCTTYKVVEAYTDEHQHLVGKAIKTTYAKFTAFNKGDKKSDGQVLFAWVGEIIAEVIPEDHEKIVVVTPDARAEAIREASERFSASTKIDGECKGATGFIE